MRVSARFSQESPSSANHGAWWRAAHLLKVWQTAVTAGADYAGRCGPSAASTSQKEFITSGTKL
ncbi:hypothetical protein GCM10007170_19450 [Arthrobacter liuii]|uniref:Uncharacterized protein n=1 Tax=Arthrobacter liuii TaxID=1476996 RepID=A0ABQ2ARX5_9MICC|nr:hypothetical protein GCM10007170_19450 [Arthrobacter liuii]